MESRDNKQKLELIATIKLDNSDDFYRVIDFLNRSLKRYNLMFGLTRKDNKMILSVYEF